MASIHRHIPGDRDGSLCFKAAIKRIGIVPRKQYLVPFLVEDETDATIFAARLNKLESIVDSGGELDSKTEKFLDSLSPKFYAKLCEAGWVESEEIPQATNGKTCVDLAELYIAWKQDQEGISQEHIVKSCRSLDYFATIFPNTALDDLNLESGITLKEKLFKGEGYVRLDHPRFGGSPPREKRVSSRSPSTVDSILKHVLEAIDLALDEGYLERNPFKRLSRPGQHKAENERVEAETVLRLIDATDNTDQKIILALARFCGIRTPSELTELRWGHIQFGDDPHVLIHSPKTGRYEGKDIRICPLLLRDVDRLLENWKPKGAGKSDFVIENAAWRKKKGSANDSWLGKLLKREGVPRWNRLWQSLRESAESDMRSIPGVDPEQVSMWIGHDIATYRKHYRGPSEEVRKTARESLLKVVG